MADMLATIYIFMHPGHPELFATSLIFILLLALLRSSSNSQKNMLAAKCSTVGPVEAEKLQTVVVHCRIKR